MDTIIVLQCYKSTTLNGEFKEYNMGTIAVGETREALLKWLEGRYGIPEGNFKKDPKMNFPWFTDGGFKYIIEQGYWKYEFIAHPYEILK